MDPPSGAVHARLLFAFRGGSEARAAASAETASKSFAYPLHVRLIYLDVIAAAHVQLTALSTYQQRDAVPPLVTTNLLPSDTRTTSRRAAEEIIAKKLHKTTVPVVVPGYHDEPVCLIPGKERGQEFPLASPPQDLYRIGKAAVPPFADICHLLQWVRVEIEVQLIPLIPKTHTQEGGYMPI